MIAVVPPEYRCVGQAYIYRGPDHDNHQRPFTAGPVRVVCSVIDARDSSWFVTTDPVGHRQHPLRWVYLSLGNLQEGEES